jgi:hypothetical protein
MSNSMRGSEAVRDMEANLIAGLAETYSPHPFIVLPFANPYIPWPPYFDYLSHFASSTLAFTRIGISAKFQKGKNGPGYRKQAF